MTDGRVTLRDVLDAGYCASGAREWFRANGLDFRTFVREGISREDFLATGCHLAQDIVKKKDAKNG